MKEEQKKTNKNCLTHYSLWFRCKRIGLI